MQNSHLLAFLCWRVIMWKSVSDISDANLIENKPWDCFFFLRGYESTKTQWTDMSRLGPCTDTWYFHEDIWTLTAWQQPDFSRMIKSLFLFAVWSHNMCHCTNGYKITWLHYQYVIIQTHNSAPWFLWEKDCTLYKHFAVSALDNTMMGHNGVTDEHLSEV